MATRQARAARTAQWDSSPASGPFPFLNPTERRRAFPAAAKVGDQGLLGGTLPPIGNEGDGQDRHGDGSGRDSGLNDGEKDGEKKGAEKDEILAKEVEHKWRSRDNRKGRHTIAITPTIDKDANYLTPPSSSSIRAIIHGLIRMVTVCPYWDVSYLVAIIFTLGSVIWVFNAFFVWLPLEAPSTEFSGEEDVAGGVTAFIGATVFEIGSVLLMLEAINEDRSECFGWAVEEVAEEHEFLKLRPAPEECRHHHGNRRNFVGKGKVPSLETKQTGEATDDGEVSKDKRKWSWWPTTKELTSHYLRETGFLACFAQFLGATIFWISGFTALPGIYNHLSTPALNGAYWAPQVIGGTGFIVSGFLFMVETQKKWYMPALDVLGWHIGFWNLVGAIGFTLCGALGYGAANSGVAYESSLATFWGSWAFLIGSVVQWYESLDKNPVDVEESVGKREEDKGDADA